MKISTEYCNSFRVKNKTFVIFLKAPNLVEIHGAGVSFQLKIENDKPEFDFKYSEEFIWDCVKKTRKIIKKDVLIIPCFDNF